MRLATTTLIALLLVCLGGTAVAAGPGEDAALFRLVATLAGAETANPIPVVVEGSARYEARRAAQAVRGYGPVAQDARCGGARRARHRRDSQDARGGRRPLAATGRPVRHADAPRPRAPGRAQSPGGGRARVRERTPGPAVRTRTDRRAGARRSPGRARRGPGSCRARRRSPRARPGGAGPREPARAVRRARDLLHLVRRPSLLGDAAESRWAPCRHDLALTPAGIDGADLSHRQVPRAGAPGEDRAPGRSRGPAACDRRQLRRARRAHPPRRRRCAAGRRDGLRMGRRPDGDLRRRRLRGGARRPRLGHLDRRRRMGAGGTHLPRSRARLAGREAVALRGNNVLADRRRAGSRSSTSGKSTALVVAGDTERAAAVARAALGIG